MVAVSRRLPVLLLLAATAAAADPLLPKFEEMTKQGMSADVYARYIERGDRARELVQEARKRVRDPEQVAPMPKPQHVGWRLRTRFNDLPTISCRRARLSELGAFSVPRLAGPNRRRRPVAATLRFLISSRTLRSQMAAHFSLTPSSPKGRAITALAITRHYSDARTAIILARRDKRPFDS